jgi:CDP-diacylglycerol--glycerol-3-phosphate 3-phosphatidyltransferase
MDKYYPNTEKYQDNSRKTLAGWLLAFFGLTAGVVWRIGHEMASQGVWIFIIGSLTVGIYWFGLIWKNLAQNRETGGSDVLPSLGLPNQLTIIRGFLIAITTGLILVPNRAALIAWLPGIFYLCAVLMDGIDGILARTTGNVTVLGEFLDMEMDSLTVLVGSLAVFLSGKADGWILLVGTARYLYVGGQWLLKRSRRPLLPLAKKSSRRALAGLMMGFLAAAMFPVFYPPAIKVISYFIILPFLVGFLDDWIQTGGMSLPSWEKMRGFGKSALRFANRWLLPGMRIAIVLLFLFVSMQIKQAANLSATTIWILFVLSIALLTGTAGRVSAIALVIVMSLEINVDSFAIPVLLILICSCIIFLMGTGRFSFWKPEEHYIFHRIGDNEQS